MSVLLTGATGFVGENFYDKYGRNCRCVVRNSPKYKLDNTFRIDGLTELTNWDGAFDGIKTVVHLAGVAHDKSCSENDFDKVNHLATLHLAKEAVAANVKRFIYISSIGVNGFQTNNFRLNENSKSQPYNEYTRSKMNAEVSLLKLAEESGLELVILRPALVYGKNAKGSFKQLTSIISKLKILPFALVDNRRSFISVYNLCDFINLCTIHPMAANELFLLSDEQDLSTKEFSRGIAKGLCVRLFQLPIPIKIMKFTGHLFGKSHLMTQLFDDFEVDSSKSRRLLDWSPQYTMEMTMRTLTANRDI